MSSVSYWNSITLESSTSDLRKGEIFNWVCFECFLELCAKQSHHNQE